MFIEEKKEISFTWNSLGDVPLGRPNLGDSMPVLVYRLMQFTLRDTLLTRHGAEEAGRIFCDAGRLAGEQFCENLLDRTLPLDKFLAQVQQKMKELGIGLVRVEKLDPESLHMTLAVHEDLDCSGLPDTGETVCEYDEGFIAGIFNAYAKLEFVAREVDCWASGGRVCRFDVTRA